MLFRDVSRQWYNSSAKTKNFRLRNRKSLLNWVDRKKPRSLIIFFWVDATQSNNICNDSWLVYDSLINIIYRFVGGDRSNVSFAFLTFDTAFGASQNVSIRRNHKRATGEPFDDSRLSPEFIRIKDEFKATISFRCRVLGAVASPWKSFDLPVPSSCGKPTEDHWEKETCYWHHNK